MFTGIIEEIGRVERIDRRGQSAVIRIRCRKVLGREPAGPYEVPTALGDSIAVNGICLTVTKLGPDTFEADVMPETIRRSSLSLLTAGSRVNLERAMPAYGRFGGHFVTGHIDGTGTILRMQRDENAVWIDVQIPRELAPSIAEKGSIAIDGISLTVARTKAENGHYTFSVSIIPHTLAETSLADRKPGDPVNLETDPIARYVRQLALFGEIPADPAARAGGKAAQAAGSPARADDQAARDRRLEALLQNF